MPFRSRTTMTLPSTWFQQGLPITSDRRPTFPLQCIGRGPTLPQPTPTPRRGGGEDQYQFAESKASLLGFWIENPIAEYETSFRQAIDILPSHCPPVTKLQKEFGRTQSSTNCKLTEKHGSGPSTSSLVTCNWVRWSNSLAVSAQRDPLLSTNWQDPPPIRMACRRPH